MDNQKLITSKEDKEKHGIGFQRVCEVVKEKNGIITRTVNHKILSKIPIIFLILFKCH